MAVTSSVCLTSRECRRCERQVSRKMDSTRLTPRCGRVSLRSGLRSRLVGRLKVHHPRDAGRRVSSDNLPVARNDQGRKYFRRSFLRHGSIAGVMAETRGGIRNRVSIESRLAVAAWSRYSPMNPGTFSRRSGNESAGLPPVILESCQDTSHEPRPRPLTDSPCQFQCLASRSTPTGRWVAERLSHRSREPREHEPQRNGPAMFVHRKDMEG